MSVWVGQEQGRRLHWFVGCCRTWLTRVPTGRGKVAVSINKTGFRMVWVGREHGRRLHQRVGGCHMWLPRVPNDRGQVAVIKNIDNFCWLGLGKRMGGVYINV